MRENNLLMISWDPSAASEPTNSAVRGEVRTRLQAYGKHLGNLHMITYTPDEETYAERVLSKNVFVHPTRCSRLSFLITAYRIGRNLLTAKGADIITCQDPLFCGLVGYLLGKRFGIPVVMDVHGDFIDNPYWLAELWRYRVYNLLAKFLIRRADAVRVDSSKIEEQMYRQFGRTKDSVFRVPVFAHTSRFGQGDGVEIREKYHDYDFIVLFVGRMVESKNIPNLLDAVPSVLEQHPRTLFLLVGSGPLKDEWELRARKNGLGDNVVFTDHVPDVAPFFDACDLFVMPTNYEGRAIVLVEALASGKPVVSTDVSGARDTIMEGKSGHIVPIKDPLALAEAINNLLEDPERMRAMGMFGREDILRTQDLDANAERVVDIYRTLAARCKNVSNTD